MIKSFCRGLLDLMGSLHLACATCIRYLFCLMCVLCLSMVGCGKQVSNSDAMNSTNLMNSMNLTSPANEAPKTLDGGLTWSGKLELQYAKEFAVDYYKDSQGQTYRLIRINQENPLLLVEQPSNIYLVASQVMDIFVALDKLNALGYSAVDEKDWYIDEAKQAMHDGAIRYAGKYSAPDYEMLASGKCDLAIENTMIYHSPKVRERLEELGIPVIVDRSSYETEPLGRTEWVMLYGALVGCEELAKDVFESQVQSVNQVQDSKLATKPVVAFFYIASNGEIKVRKSSDYLPKMIEMAGGQYAFAGLTSDEDNASSTMTLQLEKFYAMAKDADYIIYNSTVDGELQSVEDLIGKNELLSKFKAVQEGNVYCISKNLFQSTMELGDIVADIHRALIGEEGMKYLYPLR